MFRILALFVALTGFLAACEQPGPRVNEAGDVLRPFWIAEADTAEVQFRHLDAVNAIREANGLVPVQLSSELIAAAKAHAIDMSKQNRPWDFGSDGSSPLDRVARVGYQGEFISENISETYEDDMQTLQAWMDDPVARSSILSPKARFMGIAWFQESNGKLWWVQLLGS
jgi:uncharacterized protein YkwD